MFTAAHQSEVASPGPNHGAGSVQNLQDDFENTLKKLLSIFSGGIAESAGNAGTYKPPHGYCCVNTKQISCVPGWHP